MTNAKPIRDWLAELGLAQHAETFEREQIDLDALRHLTEDNLKDLGLPLGHRVKLLAAIRVLSASPAAAQGTQAGLSPQTYTPRHLAEKILSSRVALEGERKQVTVLFCDMANSTRLAEKLGAEAMHALLQRFFALSLEEVHRYEGTVNQFLGDGFMALFGAPVAHEDDARRGVLAALGIRRALRERQAELGLQQADELQVRMGLNTGLVVVGSIGDNLRMDYTAIGDTTNLAARLQQSAHPGQILVSAATARLVSGYAKVEALPPLAVKGKSEPVQAYELTAVGARRSRLDTARLSPFVGRERELALLVHAAEEAATGRGQVVGIVGEAGVGKSRLLYEFRRVLQAKGTRFVEAMCQSFGQSMPYLPLQDVIRAECEILESDAPGEVRNKVSRSLAHHGLAPEQAAAYLLRLLGLTEGTEALEGLGPETIQLRIHDSFVQFLQTSCASSQLILVLEDLHWMDRSSEECMAALVERLPRSPILLVTSTRPGYSAPWVGKSYVAQLPLAVLSDEASREIVAATMRHSQRTGSLTKAILEKAEGNPLFLEELTLALEADARDLASGLPDTIQGVLAARIDRLPEPAKRVLEIASVLGREFPARLLEAVCGAEADLRRELATLTRLELLYERVETRAPMYMFKHALTQEAAYDSLLTGPRAALHEAAGCALEQLYPDRLEEYAELLAHHFFRSPAKEKALEYLSRADRKAIAANAVFDAKGYFEQAMRVLDALPDTAENRHCRIELLVRQIHVFILTNTLDEYERYLERYAPIAEALSDQGLRGHFQSCLGHTQFGLGRPQQAIGTLGPAAALCVQAENFQGAGQAYVHLQWSHLLRGDFEDVLAFETPALAALARAPNLRLRLYALSAATWACAALARWDSGIERATTALAECEQAADVSLISFAYWNLSIPYIYKGAVEEAICWAQRGFETAPTPNDRAWSQLFYGWALIPRAPMEAVVLLAPLVPLWLGRWNTDALALVTLGEAYFRAGQLEQARATFEQAIERAQPSGMLYVVAPAQRLLGEMLLAENRLEESEARFEQALELYMRFKSQNEVAVAQAGYGRLRARQGRRGEARALLRQALTTFERLGTVAELERVRAELAALG
jgi:class 3 adenylate cyclase/tetratricopeptide (TPR) repeat protein